MSTDFVDKFLIIDCLQELCDLDYQQRAWVVGIPNEVTGFNDVIAALFDDSGLERSLRFNDVTFSIEIDKMLLLLEKKVDSLPDNIMTKELLSHPNWVEVVRLSNEIYLRIKQPE